MENFDWTSFTRKIAVKSDLKTMYAAWTNNSMLEKWFLSKAELTDSDGKHFDDAQEGLNYAWQWFGYDVTEYGEYLEMNGKDRVAFRFAEVCIVTIDLKEMDGEIMVSLIQSGIPTDDNSKQHIRLGCDTGWSFFMVNLKSVFEGGLDLRNKNENFKGVINS